MNKLNNKKNYWDISYNNKDNFLLYPNEEIIRFFNKYIKRRITFKVKKKNKIVLDIGCGTGRHLLYCIENGFFSIGLDISSVALKQCKKLLKFKKYKLDKNYDLINSNSSKINLKDHSIDILVSHATLDSMPSNEIKKTVDEMFRVMKINSLGYVDLISDKIKRKGKFLNKFDQLINEKHEKNTIQSYFNLNRIKKLFSKFEILEIYRVDKVKDNKILNARYSIIFKK